jgi:hypothetical protein
MPISLWLVDNNQRTKAAGKNLAAIKFKSDRLKLLVLSQTGVP